MPYKPARNLGYRFGDINITTADPRFNVSKWLTEWHATWWLSREWWRVGLTSWQSGNHGKVYHFRLLLLRIGVYRPKGERS